LYPQILLQYANLIKKFYLALWRDQRPPASFLHSFRRQGQVAPAKDFPLSTISKPRVPFTFALFPLPFPLFPIL
jgi:hypothetical protein